MSIRFRRLVRTASVGAGPDSLLLRGLATACAPLLGRQLERERETADRGRCRGLDLCLAGGPATPAGVYESAVRDRLLELGPRGDAAVAGLAEPLGVREELAMYPIEQVHERCRCAVAAHRLGHLARTEGDGQLARI